jgi:hypothetical protein
MVTTRIGDLVEANLGGGFRPDVVLDSYRKPAENLDLARSYIFTSHAPPQKHATANLVRRVAEAFLPGRQGNRFVIIATYGHGKSHFAVALANYFGQTAESAAGAEVLNNLRHALETEPARFEWLADFRRDHRPCLVLLLRGDEPSDLPTKFFRALDEALEADPIAAARAPRFWYDGAERFLDRIPEAFRASADAFLADRRLDLSVLRDKVGRRETRMYEICRLLHYHLYHSWPDFEATTSLEEAVKRLVDALCGPDGPYGGVLVLFDELSVFVRDYAAMAGTRPGTPLQDLLNGVAARRERAVFVGFAQHDPDTVADRATAHLPQTAVETLKKELGRLPPEDRLFLHSSLETVLDSYLKQDVAAFDRLLASHSGFQSALFNATDETRRLFRSRYDTELGWSESTFERVVTRGCYPLHPMTTGLLCSVELQSTGAGSARTVLGFVKEMLEIREHEAAVRDDRPNWVLPIELASYFRDMLGEEYWKPYGDALDAAGGADTPADERAVLQAMLLLRAADPDSKLLPTREIGYGRVIGQFAGLTRSEAEAALRRLADRGIIQLDPTTGRAAFWAGGKTGQGVEKLLAAKLADRPLTSSLLNDITALLRDKSLLTPQGVSVPWGNPEDWQAQQVLVGRFSLTVETLRAFEDQLRWRLDGVERERGFVLWGLAETDDDVEWFRATAPALLSEAFADRPTPLVVMAPHHANPTLVRHLRRAWGLDRFTSGERAQVGQEQFAQVRDTTEKALRDELSQFMRYEVGSVHMPPAIRAQVQAVKSSSISNLLSEVYRLAYPDGPGAFITTFKATTPTFRRSVARVANLLLKDGLGLPSVLDGHKQAQDVANYLQTTWGLVDGNRTVRQPPPTSRLHRGWHELSAHIAAGEGSKPIRPVLERLLSPPWGYDHNTLMLLFCAWFGYYRRDVEVSKDGKIVSIEALAKDPKGTDFLTPDKFWPGLGTVSLKRRAADALEMKTRAIISRVNNSMLPAAQAGNLMTAEEARNDLAALSDYCADQRGDPKLKLLAEQAQQRIQHALTETESYDRDAAALLKSVAAERLVLRLCDALGRIAKLPSPTLIAPTQPKPPALRETVLGRIAEQTEIHCIQYQKLDRIEDYTLKHQYLTGLRASLVKADLRDHITRVDEAMRVLETRKAELEQAQLDAVKIAEVQVMATTGSLGALRRLAEHLDTLAFVTENGRRIQRTKAEQLANAIRTLEERVRAYTQAVCAATTLKQLEAARDNLLKLEAVVADAPDEAAAISAAIAHCRRLYDYQDRIRAAIAEPPSTPADAERAVSMLMEIPASYGADLSEAQRHWATSAVEAVRKVVAQREREARDWLRQCERDAADRDRLMEVQDRLRQPPVFLADSDQERLDALRGKVQQQLAKYAEVQVIELFKRIPDVARRRTCLDRLRRLAEELERA